MEFKGNKVKNGGDSVDKSEKRRIRWVQAKQELMKDFNTWIKECDYTRNSIPEDMIEFLFQKGYIKGKKWQKFINNVAEMNKEYRFFIHYEPLREGFIPPDTWI